MVSIPRLGRKFNSAKKVKHFLQAFFAVAVVLLYTAEAIEVDSIHSLFHDKNELHTALLEKDPCHKAIYHHDKHAGCTHKSHVAKTQKCPLCQLCFHNAHLSTEVLKPLWMPAVQVSKIQDEHLGYVLLASGNTSRAPPVV